jgi:T5orf172 domain
MPEFIYILTNEAMPGLIKIGKTSNSVAQRIRELDGSGIPLPFQCFYAARVENALFVETRLHKAFGDFCVRANREFFRLDPFRAQSALELAALEDVTPRGDVVETIAVWYALSTVSASMNATLATMDSSIFADSMPLEQFLEQRPDLVEAVQMMSDAELSVKVSTAPRQGAGWGSTPHGSTNDHSTALVDRRSPWHILRSYHETQGGYHGRSTQQEQASQGQEQQGPTCSGTTGQASSGERSGAGQDWQEMT